MNTPVDAATAREIGLVTPVVADDELDADVDATARALTAGAKHAQGEAKRLLRTSLDESLALHLEAEAAAIVRSAEQARRTPRGDQCVLGEALTGLPVGVATGA